MQLLYSQFSETAEQQLVDYYSLVASSAAVAPETVSPAGWAAGAESEFGHAVPDADSAIMELWASVLTVHRSAIAARIAPHDAPAFNALFAVPS